MTVLEAATDTGFQQLPDEEKIKALSVLDKNFAKLDKQNQASALQGLMGMNAKPPVSNQTESSFGEGTLRKATIGAQGFNEGVARTLGLPVDIVTGVLNAAGAQIKKPLGGSESLQEDVMPKTVFPASQQSGGERIVSRVGQEIGATAPLIPLAAAGLASRGVVGGGEVAMAQANTAWQGVKAMPPIILDQLASIPPAVLAKAQIVIAAAAGAGAGTAKEFAERLGAGHLASQYAEFFGQLIGSFGPTALMDALGKTKRLVTSILPPVRAEAIKEEVGRQLKTVLGPSETASGNIEKARQLQQDIPGFKPTLGQATGEPTVIAKERALQSRGPEAQGLAHTQVGQSNQAIRRELTQASEHAIGGPEGPQAVQDSLARLRNQASQAVSAGETEAANATTTALSDFDKRIESRLNTSAWNVAEEQAKAHGTIHGLEPITTESQIRGQAIRGELVARNQEFSQESTRRYNAVDPGQRIRLSTSMIKDGVQEARALIGRFGSDIPVLTTIEQKLQDAESITDLHRLRQQVWNAGLNDPQTKAMLKPVRDGIDQTFDAFGQHGQMVAQVQMQNFKAAEKAKFDLEVYDADKGGYRVFTEAQTGGGPDVTGFKSTAPDWYKDLTGKGQEGSMRITRDQVDKALDKFARGESPVTDRENVIFEKISSIERAVPKVNAEQSYVENATRKFKETNAWYAGELKKYRINAAEDVLAKGGKGVFRVPDSAVAEAFFNKRTGAREAAQQFKVAVGGNTQAETALHDHVKQSFLDAAVDVNGVVNPKRMMVWMRQHREALAEFPSIRAEFLGAVKAQQSVDIAIHEQTLLNQEVKAQRTAIVNDIRAPEDALSGKATESYFMGKRTLDEVEKGAAKLYLNSDADLSMGKALQSSNPEQSVRDLVNLVQGDETAMRGLRRSLYDRLEMKAESGQTYKPTGERLLNPKAMADFLDKNEKVLRVLYDEAFLKKLRTIQEASDMLGKTQAPLRAGTDTAEKIQGIPSFASMEARMYAVLSGRVSENYIAAGAVARFANALKNQFSTKKLNALMEEAFYNPEVAQTLVQISKGAPQDMIIKRLHSHLINMGLEQKDRKE